MVCFMVFAGVCWHRGVTANGAPMPLTAFGDECIAKHYLGLNQHNTLGRTMQQHRCCNSRSSASFWPLCSESWPPQHAAPSDIGTICAKLRVLALSMLLHAILNQPSSVLLGHFDSRSEWQKKMMRAARVLHARSW